MKDHQFVPATPDEAPAAAPPPPSQVAAGAAFHGDAA